MRDALMELVRNAQELVSDGYYGEGAPRYEGPSFSHALLSHGTFPIIAEVKLASPSKGPLSPHAPRRLITDYVRGGAAALSVLTEPRFFHGSLGDLDLAVASGLPCLMKDIVVSEEQVSAAAAHGAGAVLLIQEVFGEALPPKRRDELIDHAHGQGLEVVLEATSEEGLRAAMSSEADLLGINQRDLRTLELDQGKGLALLPVLSTDPRPIIVMSGVHGRSVVMGLRDHGADAVLIGGHLSSSINAEAALRELEVPR